MQTAWGADGPAAGPLSAINFTSINVNVGGVWQASKSAAIIPAGELRNYYVHLEVATPNNKGIMVALNSNSKVVFYINHNITNNNAAQVRNNKLSSCS